MNIFTENPDLYPTPVEVIDRMLEEETISGRTVLEPSAGTGNIVTRLAELGAREILACENDPNKRAILRDKPCELIAEDFLTLRAEDIPHVDLICMNPPFTQDMDHIIHAWEIAPEGCTVIALCNATHIGRHGYCNEKRQHFLELIEDHGLAEDIGQVFKGCRVERETDVYVGLVKLFKPKSGAAEFEDYTFDQGPGKDFAGADTPGLMTYDFIRDIVQRYVSAVSLFDDVKRRADEINALARFPGTNVYSQPPIEFKTVYAGSDKRIEVVSHDRYKKELQKYYWRIIFNKMDLERFATEQLRKQINRFVERQQNVPFTMGNIYKVISIILQTNGQRMQTALLDAFDMICNFSSENSTAGEKWKTNSNYMVNRRFIVPYITKGYRWDDSPNPYVEIEYGGNLNRIEDIVRALCWFTRTDYAGIPDLQNLCRKDVFEWGKWFEWGFFRCRAYKKGTMHFEFLDENIWARFNAEVASVRGWELPQTTNESKKKANRKKAAEQGSLFA